MVASMVAYISPVRWITRDIDDEMMAYTGHRYACRLLIVHNTRSSGYSNALVGNDRKPDHEKLNLQYVLRFQSMFKYMVTEMAYRYLDDGTVDVLLHAMRNPLRYRVNVYMRDNRVVEKMMIVIIIKTNLYKGSKINNGRWF